MHDPASTPFTITDKAARRILEIAVRQGKPRLKLRVAVDGGGCSGFQYHFDLTEQDAAADTAIEHQGATVLIDATSLLYLSGAELDFVEDMIGASFKLNNPNAVSSCGCGTSFAV